MKNYVALTIFASGMFLFAACDSGNNQQQETDTATAQGEPVVAPDSALTDDQKDMFQYAHSASNYQVQLGRLAVERSQTEEIRQYGQQMIDLYGTKITELRDLAQEYQVTAPETLKDDHADDLQSLKDTKPENFDQEYLDEVIDAHKESEERFDKSLNEIAETSASAFSLWARNSHKEARAHKEEAMRLEVLQ